MVDLKENKKAGIRPAVRCAVFLVIGALLFVLFQNILVNKYTVPQITGPMRNAMKTKEESDVLFLGTSHVIFGVQPMQLYQEQGLITENLATSVQPIEVSYFLLKEKLSKHTPQVVMLDVSGLFLTGMNEEAWRYVMNDMPLSSRKLEMAQAYTQAKGKDSDPAEDIFSVLVPLYKYHTRWKQLKKQDFDMLLFGSEEYYRVYNFYTKVVPGNYDVQGMNALAEQMAQDDTKLLYGYGGNGFYDVEKRDVLYSCEVPKENQEWLGKIQQLCEESGARLVLFKVPTVYSPNEYSSAWTRQRSQYIKELAQEYDLTFLDLLYDTDLGIDWQRDSIDGGQHLNWNGAQKVGRYLGEWLTEVGGVEARQSELFDKNLVIFQDVAEIAQLQVEMDLTQYLTRLGKMEKTRDLAVFMACSQDMTEALTQEEINALSSLGLRTWFQGMQEGEAFFAILDHGTVVHEANSNRSIRFLYELEDGGQLQITTEGWLGEAKANIEIDEVDYAVNQPGLNIVVYDNESQTVIDSVAFSLSADSEQKTARTLEKMASYLDNYEAWLVKNIGKRDAQ